MYLTELFGLFSLSAFIVWGFMMAFFFNVFVYSLNIKRNSTLLLSSFVMLISYWASDYFFSLLSYSAVSYLDWAIYDVITIVCLLLVFWKVKNTTSSFLYLIVGLIANSLLFLAMYIDTTIANNKEPWVLWDIYSFGVNIIDFMMIVALIVDRDILGLNKLKNIAQQSLTKSPALKSKKSIEKSKYRPIQKLTDSQYKCI